MPVWVTCTGHSLLAGGRTIDPRDGIVSLNRYLVWQNGRFLRAANAIPRYHWMVEAGPVSRYVSGTNVTNSTPVPLCVTTARKSSNGFYWWSRTNHECELAYATAVVAALLNVTVISKEPVIQFMRWATTTHTHSTRRTSKKGAEIFIEYRQWRADHIFSHSSPPPLPWFGYLSLGHALELGVGMLPSGGDIHLLGCDGGATVNHHRPHVDLQRLRKRTVNLTSSQHSTASPWNVSCCNKSSHYVRLGLVPYAPCTGEAIHRQSVLLSHSPLPAVLVAQSWLSKRSNWYQWHDPGYLPYCPRGEVSCTL